jgi:hypothetical protein
MKFSEIPYFIIKEYLNILNTYHTDDNIGMLIGPNTSIVTNGGNNQSFFLKDEDYGYRPISLEPYFNNYLDEDKINFTESLSYDSELNTTDTSDSYSLGYYTLTARDSNIEPGNEIYIRKDSPFYEWLNNNASTYLTDQYDVDFVIRNYINTDKDYIYFGEIYSNVLGDNTYHIIHYNIQNFVINSIPYHQRTEKFKDFIGLNFDILYNEIYHLSKDLFSMLDPYEINENYLKYLADYFNFDFENYDIPTQVKRDLIKNGTNLLKMKGTYSALYSIWNIFTNNSLNRLNIYDQWIYKLPYSEFSNDIVIQSREDNPIGQGDVIFSDTLQGVSTTEIYNDTGLAYFDNALVVDNFTNSDTWTITSRNENYYKLGYSVSQAIDSDRNFIYPEIITILDENFLDVDPFVEVHAKVNDLRKELDTYTIVSGYYVYTITHNLNSKVLVTVFENDIQAIPDEISYIDNQTIEIKTTEILNNAYAHIIKSEQTYTITNQQNLTIDHNLNTYSILTQVLINNILVQPFNIQIVNKNRIKLDFKTNVTGEVLLTQGSEIYEPSLINIFDENNEKIIPTNIYENPATGYFVITFPTSASGKSCMTAPLIEVDQIEKSKIWEIEHNLDSIQLIVQVRDDNYYIQPKEIEFVDRNNLRILFDEEINGTVVIGRGYEANESLSKLDVGKNALLNYRYTDLYNYEELKTGVGSFYYSRYKRNDSYPEFDKKIISTQYLIEIDLNTEGVDNTEILSENSANFLYDFWESFRPINRIANYNLLIAPETDLSGYYHNIYDSNNIYLKSKSVDFQISLPDSFVKIFESDTTWTVNHNLNTENLIVQIINSDLEEVIPKKIEFSSSNIITVTFDEEVNGFILIKKTLSLIEIPSGSTSVTHNKNQTEVISQFRRNNAVFYIGTTLTDTISVELDYNDEKFTSDRLVFLLDADGKILLEANGKYLMPKE